jgi:hypothetical protein
MPPQRNSGWAQLPDKVTPAISWQGVALNNALNGATPATDGPLLKMLSKYDRVTNPTGVQMPDFGDYTPLTGALTNVAEYLKSYIDTDPYSGCGRRYYVLLLTDGEEQPPLPANDPIGAVTALRNLVSNGGIRVDVKTSSSGSGSPGPCPSSTRWPAPVAPPSPRPTPASSTWSTASPGQGRREPPPGLAGHQLREDPLRLLHPLEAGGERPRDEMYVGYMRILQGLEWQGKLDSIDIKTTNLPTSPTPSPATATTITCGATGT